MELAPGYITSPCKLAFSNNFNLDEAHIFHELLANFKSNSFQSHQDGSTATELQKSSQSRQGI